jgi:hypothetical protein
MKAKFVLLFLLVALLGSCKVTFVPDYDADISKQILDAAKANDLLYLELLAAPMDKRDYTDYTKEYLLIEGEINSLALRNEARKKNGEMMDIIKRLHAHFNEVRDEHRTTIKPLNDAQLKDYEEGVKAFWKVLLLAEQGLPHAK